MKVYDISGRLIQKIEIPSFGAVMTTIDTGISEVDFTIDLSDLADGLYLLNVIEETVERLLILK